MSRGGSEYEYEDVDISIYTCHLAALIGVITFMHQVSFLHWLPLQREYELQTAVVILYNGDLKSGLVWIVNHQKEVGSQMVWISNGI